MEISLLPAKINAQTMSQRNLMKLFGKQMETHPTPVGPSLIVRAFSSVRPLYHSKTFPPLQSPQVFALNLQWAVD